jgi:hypothetical protein
VRTGYKQCRAQSKVKRTKTTTKGNGKSSPKMKKAKMSASPQNASPSPNRRGYYPGYENASLFAPNYDPLLGPFGKHIVI